MIPMYILRASLVGIATFVFGSVGVLVSLFDATGDRQMRIARGWSRVLLAASSIKVRVEGLNNIAAGGGYVFVSNHLSYMDTPVVLANIPVQFRFLAKKGLFQIPLLGTHLARAGHIPVPRENPRAAVKTMTRAAEIIRERGISMLIFPEGGRSQDGHLQAFKEGAAYIAIKAGAALVPVALIGTREVLPFGSGRIRGGTVTMRIGAPMPTATLKSQDRDRVTQELRNQIVTLLEEPSIAV